MRAGISTGTCAAAAAKAAVLALYRGQAPSEIAVGLPSGATVTVPLAEVRRGEGWGEAGVVKDAGDDPDVTHGLLIVARAQPDGTAGTGSGPGIELGGGIILRGGLGVGFVTRPGLAIPVGEPAINPVPRDMIRRSVSEALPPGRGAVITISVPRGRETAVRTMNGRLGVVGGISILGTSGIVRPMSKEAWQESLIVQLDQAVATGHRRVILTPGKIGENASRRLFGAPAEAVVQMSNFVGYMLKGCADRGIEGVILSGHHGKIVKVAAGVFDTHSRLADARRETLAAHAAALGARPGVAEALLEANTAEACLDILDSEGLSGRLMSRLAQRASQRAEEYLSVLAPGGGVRVGTALLDLKGNPLAIDEAAQKIAREAGWTTS